MSNKIIEPIQSRCAILRYSKLRDAEVMKRLKEICAAEDVRLLVWSKLMKGQIQR
jgi:replication factor C subunit 2/4